MAILSDNAWFLPLTIVLVLLVVWLVYRRVRASRAGLEAVLNDIAFERMDGLVLPNADEGLIQIDHLLLTPKGLLVLHIKDAPGTVFGADKMQEWTVMANDGRYTFSNPLPALYDRVAAVRHIVRDVPVEGRVLFLEGAEFTKGTPELVRLPGELHAEFGEADKSAAKRKIEAFIPHWERLGKHAEAG